MNNNDNTAPHRRPPPLNGSQPEAASGEAAISDASENSNVHRLPALNGVQPEAAGRGGGISNGSSGNNVHGRIVWVWCSRCNTSLPQPVSFLRRPPVWCSICNNFNPLWGSLFTNEDPNYGRNSTNDDSDHQERRADRENVELPDNTTVGRQQLSKDRDNAQLLEEIISTYLSTRHHKKSVKEKGEGDHICAVCQDGFIEEEVSIRLDCEHDYHYQCITQWLLHKNYCPLCIRTVIPPDIEFDSD